MKFYLMRHAEAESGAQLDPTRDLTDTGRTQAKMMGKWLARQSEQPEILLQSNFQRSKETAKQVGKRLGIEPMLCPDGALDPDTDPEVCWQVMKNVAKDKGVSSIIAVTHGPLVERMLAYLTNSQSPQQYHFCHAAIAHFETTTGKRGILHWLVTPNVVARDEDEMDAVTADAHATLEAALEVAEALID